MLITTLILKLSGDSMKSLFGLKNLLIFSAVLFTIGSVSAQQAFAGFFCDCESESDGDWDSVFTCDIPMSGENVCIHHNVELNDVGVGLDMEVTQGGSLLIGCDGDLTATSTLYIAESLVNHGSVDVGHLSGSGLIQNSSSAFTYNTNNFVGTFENISSICDRPIGGTVGSMDTVSLLVAGAQANMGLMSLALVGIVGAAAAVTYKLKSNKTDE